MPCLVTNNDEFVSCLTNPPSDGLVYIENDIVTTASGIVIPSGQPVTIESDPASGTIHTVTVAGDPQLYMTSNSDLTFQNITFDGSPSSVISQLVQMGTAGSTLTVNPGSTFQNFTFDCGGDSLFSAHTVPITVNMNQPVFKNIVGTSGCILDTYEGSTANFKDVTAEDCSGCLDGALDGTAEDVCSLFKLTGTALTDTGSTYNNNTARVFYIRGDSTVKANDITASNNSPVCNLDTGDNNGGVYYLAGTTDMNLTNSNLSSNSAANGGAIYMVPTATANISNTAFTNNTATASDGDGGAIFDEMWDPYSNLTTAPSVSFSGNSASKSVVNTNQYPNLDFSSLSTNGPTAVNNYDINAVPAIPDFDATKTVDPSTVAPGGTVTYTVSATNTGTGPANPYVLSDPLPTGMTYASGATATLNGTSVPVVVGGTSASPTFTVAGPVQPGDKVVVMFPVTVGSNVASGTVLNNTAVIQPPVPDMPPIDVPAPPVNVVGVPDFSTGVKTPSETTVHPGDTLVYTVSATNTGNGPASSFILTDTLPNGVTFTPGSTVTATINGQSVTASVSGTSTVPIFTVPGPVNPNQQVVVTFPTQVGSNVAPGTVLNNQATIAPDPQTPPTPIPSPPVDVVGTPDFPNPEKSASKQLVNPGDTFTYTVTAKNSGTGSAQPLTISDPLPNGVTFAGNAQAQLNGSSTPVSAGGNTTAPVFTIPGPVAPGDSVSLSFDVLVGNSVAPGSTLTNVARLTSYPGDPGSSTPPLNVQVGSPSFDSQKVPSLATVAPGANLSWTVTATNTGNGPAPTFVLTDGLPSYVSFDQSGSVVATVNGQSVAVNVSGTSSQPVFSIPGPIQVGDKVVVTFPTTVSVDAPHGAILQNAATISPGPNLPIVNVPAPPVHVGVPDLSDSTKTSSVSIVEPGSSFTYTISGSNTGTAPANPLTITDALPAHVAYDRSQQPVATINGSPVAVNVSGAASAPTFVLAQPVNPGDSYSLTFPVVADAGLPHGTDLSNTANVSAYPGDPGIDVEHDVLVPPVLIKKVSSPTANRCGTLTYTLTYVNYPDADSLNVYDSLPDWVYFPEGRKIAVTIGSEATFYVDNDGDESTIDFTLYRHIPSSTTTTIQFTVNVDRCAPMNCVLSNTASVTTNHNQNISNMVESKVVSQNKVVAESSNKAVVKRCATLPAKLCFCEGTAICKVRNSASFVLQECGSYTISYSAKVCAQSDCFFVAIGVCVGDKLLERSKFTAKLEPCMTRTLSTSFTLEVGCVPLKVSLVNLSKTAVNYSDVVFTVTKN